MENQAYKVIWAAGIPGAIDELAEQVLEALRLKSGASVLIDAAEYARVRWPGAHEDFLFERTREGFFMTAPLVGDTERISKWNDCVESLYGEIFDPIKDTIPMVTFGIVMGAIPPPRTDTGGSNPRDDQPSPVPKKPKVPDKAASVALTLPEPERDD